jgi:hypothetical protein
VARCEHTQDRVGELLYQPVMGQIPILECSLSDARGLLWLRSVTPGIKCHHFLKIWLQWRLPGTGEPPSVVARGPGVC